MSNLATPGRAARGTPTTAESRRSRGYRGLRAAAGRPGRAQARPGIGLGLPAAPARGAGPRARPRRGGRHHGRGHEACPARPGDRRTAGLLHAPGRRADGPHSADRAHERVRVEGPSALPHPRACWPRDRQRRVVVPRAEPGVCGDPRSPCLLRLGGRRGVGRRRTGDLPTRAFYGGWITSRIVGPFKGGPGTFGEPCAGTSPGA